MRIKDLKSESLIVSNHNGNSMELDFKNDFKKLKLILDKIDPFDNKVYQGNDVFYLTDADDNYLGHVEYTYLDKDKICINTTFSKQKGFYELLFKLILIKTPIKMIFGGNEQSESALGSWKKVMAKFQKKVYNRETKQIEDFIDSKENEYWVTNNKDLLKDKYYVGISEAEWMTSRFMHGEQMMEHRRACGRIGRTPHDMLTRFYAIDPEDAIEMVNMYPCE